MKQILPLQQVQNINPIQPVVPQYLTALGVDERLGGIENFINPIEHKVYEYDEKSLGKAKNLYKKHENTNEVVLILVDSDADGLCSSAMLYEFLLSNGASVELVASEGKRHGIEANRALLSSVVEDTGSTLLFLPDSSTNDYDAIKEFSDNGVDIVVLDHHLIEDETQYNSVYGRDNVVNINPQDKIHQNPNKNLTGAGIVKLFLDTLQEDPTHNRDVLFMLGQIGDASDTAESEVHYGVFQGYRHVKSNALLSLYVTPESVSQHALSFSIIPRMNAVARIGEPEDKESLVAMLANSYPNEKTWTVERRRKINGHFKKVTEDVTPYEYEYRALDNAKRTQDNMVNKALKEMKTVSNGNIIVNTVDVPVALNGLIANKVMQANSKPAFVGSVSDEMFSGSLRSPGFEMTSYLNESDTNAQAHGHEQAAGIKFEMRDLDSLDSGLNDIDTDVFDTNVDVLYDDDTFSQKPVLDIAHYAKIFGGSVPEPTLGFKSLKVAKRDIRMRGKVLTIVVHGVTFIMWNGKELYDSITGFDSNIALDIVGKVSKDFSDNDVIIIDKATWHDVTERSNDGSPVVFF